MNNSEDKNEQKSLNNHANLETNLSNSQQNRQNINPIFNMPKNITGLPKKPNYQNIPDINPKDKELNNATADSNLSNEAEAPKSQSKVGEKVGQKVGEKAAEKVGEKAGKVVGGALGGPLGSKIGKVIGAEVGKIPKKALKDFSNFQLPPLISKKSKNLLNINKKNNPNSEANSSTNVEDSSKEPDKNNNKPQNSSGFNDINQASEKDDKSDLSNDYDTQNKDGENKISSGKGKRNVVVSGILRIAGILTSFIGGYLVILLLIIIIVAFIMVGQSSKTLNVDEEGNITCMNITSCSTVIIPEGPSAGTYTIDEYIAGAVKYYFGTYNNAEVYKAMGVIVNSDLIYYSDMDFTNDTCTLNEKTKFNNINKISDSTTDTDEVDSSNQESTGDAEISNDNLISYGTLSSKAEIIIGYSSSIEPNENALNSSSDYKTIIKDYLRAEELQIENFGVYKICGMSGSANLTYVDMSVCNNVTITDGDYIGTYTLDDYVAGVIDHEVGGFRDTETFKAFSVAARTYLFTRSQNNDGVCYITSGNNTQAFRPTTNQQIINAVAETSGQIMTDGNGNLISTEYDAFCYESKDSVNYYLAQKHQAIPISWAYENVPKWSGTSYLENPCGTDGDGGHGRGMSQYGAYYMSTQQSKKYNEILSFYYDTGTLSTTLKADSITGELNSYGLMYPLETTGNCTSLFGNRIHPITGVQKSHGGIDIARAANTPIYAAQDGVVAVNGYDSDGWGNYVKITGNNGLDTLYAHMIRPSNLQIGQTITAGTLIGYVGQTGAATGNHLHFEIYENGTRVDPLKYLPNLCG